MGIESNFPAGHSRQSVSPVDFGIRALPDGAAAAVVEDLDRVSGMQWRVEFILRPASTVLEQRVMLYNRSEIRQPYYWWANAAVTFDDPGMRFVLPARVVKAHGRNEIETWPIDTVGSDESLVASHKEPDAWFAIGSREPFFGVYKPATRTGVAHFADPAVVPGKKVWYWGKDGDESVQKTLTDHFPSYVEIQGGLFENQDVFHFLEPEQSRVFSEYWVPIRDLSGISRVTRDAVLYLGAMGKDLNFEISATHEIHSATVRLTAGQKTVFEAAVDLAPSATFRRTVASPGPGPYSVRITDSRGSVVLEHTDRGYQAAGAETVTLGKQPAGDTKIADTETGMLAEAERSELQQRWTDADAGYKAGARKYPASVAMEKAAGRFALRMNRFDQALNLLGSAHDAAPSDEESTYLTGVAQARLGRDREARATLAAVPAGSTYGAAATLELGFLAARAKDWDSALRDFETAEVSGPSSLRRGALQIAVLRHDGRKQEALRRWDELKKLDPADTALRFEGTLLGTSEADLSMHLGADSERVLNVADEYMNLGMYDDALTVLGGPYPEMVPESLEPGAIPPGKSALLPYYREYCAKLLGREIAAPDPRTKEKLGMRYEFPYRASSFGVLEASLKSHPGDAVGHFLLGRLWMNSLMVDDAIQEWQKAAEAKARFGEPYLDLSRALNELKGDPAGAALVLKAGLAANPANADLTAALNHIGSKLSSIASGSPARAEEEPATPIGAAQAAMLDAAAGELDKAGQRFSPKLFSAEKQPDEVRRAYVEVQLQRLLAEAASAKCEAALDGLDRLGEEDPNLAFTLYGFKNFMKAPHFQYYMAAIESSCHAGKKAEKRLATVSKMTPQLPSPEFVFPILAAWRLNPETSKEKIDATLREIEGALSRGDPQAKEDLLFAQAMLFRAGNREDEAARRLQELTKDATDRLVRYLAATELRQLLK